MGEFFILLLQQRKLFLPRAPLEKASILESVERKRKGKKIIREREFATLRWHDYKIYALFLKFCLIGVQEIYSTLHDCEMNEIENH
jgi:hypothetical protein